MIVAGRAVDERAPELRPVALERVACRSSSSRGDGEAGLERARPERADEHLDARVDVEDEQPEHARRQQQVRREPLEPVRGPRPHRPRASVRSRQLPVRRRELVVVSRSPRPRSGVLKILTLASTSSGGKISGLLGQLRDRSAARASLAPLTGHDVVDPRGDLGGDRRVVHEVDHQLGRVLVRGALGDEHVVGPEHAALVGQDCRRASPSRPASATMSPDQAIARTTLPATRSSAYSLPVNARTMPGVDGLLDLGRAPRRSPPAVAWRRVLAAAEHGQARSRRASRSGTSTLPFQCGSSSRATRGSSGRRSPRCRSRARSCPTATARGGRRSGRSRRPCRRPAGWRPCSACWPGRSARPSRAG